MPGNLRDLVVGVFDGRPVFLKDVATVEDGPEEVASYVRHGWGPARGFTKHEFFPGTVLGEAAATEAGVANDPSAHSAVTIAIAKKKGSNAVWVANAVLRAGRRAASRRSCPTTWSWSSPATTA